jgi:hypothetical protein
VGRFADRYTFTDTAKSNRTENYSSVRSGFVDFVESGVGLGDELDGMIRRLSGEAASFDEGIDQSRRDLDYFERNNPIASKLITGAGIGASFFIPAATAAKVAQTGSRLARSIKMGAAGAVEGAAYGYATGRDEERTDSAMFGAAVGGGLGAGIGRYLTRNADEIEAVRKADKDALGAGGAIGGDEGYKAVGAVRRKGQDRDHSTSANERKVSSYDDVDVDSSLSRNAIADTAQAVGLNNRNWGIQNVGVRPTRLVEDADTAMRVARAHSDRMYKDNEPMFELLYDNRDIHLALANLGSTPVGNARNKLGMEEKRVVEWDDVYRMARDDKDRQAIDLYKAELEDALEVAGIRFSDWNNGKVAEELYAPRATRGDGKQQATYQREDLTEVGVLENLKPPSEALREFRNDVSDATQLLSRFEAAGVDFSLLVKQGRETRLEAVMNVIKNQVGKEVRDSGGSRAQADALSENMGNLMHSAFVNSRTGGDAVGAMIRKTASTALLANPINAVLNLAETVTAPIYQNGVAAWARTLPQLVKSGLLPRLAEKDQKWLTANQLGVSDDQFAGELMNVGKTAVGKWLNYGSQFLYKATGTSLSHRMTQEALGNAAVKRGVKLAKKDDLAKLKKHKGMAGLAESEVNSTIQALKRFDEVGYEKLSDKDRAWLSNFAGASMNEWQAISPMSMPKAFLDNPNGRVGYSMLSYMNINANNVINDIGRNLARVRKYGLNSPEGQKAYKEAAKNSAKYVALFGVVAGIWDDMRKTMDATSDYEADEILTFDGISSAALNQFGSNLSSGLINIRAEEYGGEPFNVIPAPIGLLTRGANATADLFQGEVDPALRFVESSVPVFSQVNKLSRMGMLDPDNFQRLLEGKDFRGTKLLSE